MQILDFLSALEVFLSHKVVFLLQKAALHLQTNQFLFVVFFQVLSSLFFVTFRDQTFIFGQDLELVSFENVVHFIEVFKEGLILLLSFRLAHIGVGFKVLLIHLFIYFLGVSFQIGLTEHKILLVGVPGERIVKILIC